MRISIAGIVIFTIWVMPFGFEAKAQNSPTVTTSKFSNRKYQIDGHLIENLTPIDPATFNHFRSIDPLIFNDQPIQNVFSIPEKDILALLEFGVKKHFSALQLYFHPDWKKLDQSVLFMGRDTLSNVAKVYDVSSIFPQKQFLIKKIIYHGDVYPKGTPFEKEAIVIHADRIVTIYPHPVKYKHKFLTSYEAYRVNISFRGDETQPYYYIKQLLGRNDLVHKLDFIHGPLGMEIRSIECDKQCHEMKVLTNLLPVTKKTIPIMKKE